MESCRREASVGEKREGKRGKIKRFCATKMFTYSESNSISEKIQKERKTDEKNSKEMHLREHAN